MVDNFLLLFLKPCVTGTVCLEFIGTNKKIYREGVWKLLRLVPRLVLVWLLEMLESHFPVINMKKTATWDCYCFNFS